MAAPIEAKVKASTAATFCVSLLAMLLNAVAGDSALLQPLPAWLQGLLIAVGPSLATFLAGYAAPHTPRGTAAPEPSAGPGVTPAA